MLGMNINKVYLDNFATTVTIKNKLTEPQRFFYKALLKEVKNKEIYNLKFLFSIEEIKKFIISKGKKNIKNELSFLQNNIIDIEDEEIFMSFNLISSFAVEKNQVYIELPNELVKTLKNREYNKCIDLVICKALKSKYSIFMYDFLEKNPTLKDIVLTLDEFKEIMFIENSKYQGYSSLKNKVIAPIIEELQEDFKIKLFEKKEKNKIVAINFKIK